MFRKSFYIIVKHVKCPAQYILVEKIFNKPIAHLFLFCVYVYYMFLNPQISILLLAPNQVEFSFYKTT